LRAIFSLQLCAERQSPPHCGDVGWPTPDGGTAQLCHVEETRAFRLFIAIRWRANFSGLRVELRLPAVQFTITSDDLAVGRLRLQLSVASLQWDFGSNDGLASPLQMLMGVSFAPAVCPYSRKPPRELLWKTDPKRPLIGLRHHPAESIGGILLKQSGTIHCPSTDASFPVLVRRYGTDCLILDIRSWPG